MGPVDTMVAVEPKDAGTCCVREHSHGRDGARSIIIIIIIIIIINSQSHNLPAQLRVFIKLLGVPMYPFVIYVICLALGVELSWTVCLG